MHVSRRKQAPRLQVVAPASPLCSVTHSPGWLHSSLFGRRPVSGRARMATARANELLGSRLGKSKRARKRLEQAKLGKNHKSFERARASPPSRAHQAELGGLCGSLSSASQPAPGRPGRALCCLGRARRPSRLSLYCWRRAHSFGGRRRKCATSIAARQPAVHLHNLWPGPAEIFKFCAPSRAPFLTVSSPLGRHFTFELARAYITTCRRPTGGPIFSRRSPAKGFSGRH